jgi:hypothetical protein
MRSYCQYILLSVLEVGSYKLRIQYYGFEKLLHQFQPLDLVPATRKNDDALANPWGKGTVKDFAEIPDSSNKRSLATGNLFFRKLLDKISWECAFHRKLTTT